MTTPEVLARQKIDALLAAAGWVIQDMKDLNLGAGLGVAVREFQTQSGPADYVLFVDRKAVGVIEAKKEGTTLSGVSEQTAKYITNFPENTPHVELPLPFCYESTGTETQFVDTRDPEYRSRKVFAFHKPETLKEWLTPPQPSPERRGSIPDTLRGRLQEMPEQYPLITNGLWDAQIEAIHGLEKSLAKNRPRALIQMATGSGKTFTAVSFIYRLIKFAGAKRVLFLVDRNNLGKQTLAEFSPNGDQLATASGDGTVKIWDLKPSREAQTLIPNGDSLGLSMVPSITISRDQTTLAAGSVSGVISLWDLDSGEQLGVLTGHEDFVGGLAFSLDGSRLYSSSDDQSVKIWDTNTMEELQTLYGHSGWVNNLALSPDETTLATVSSDQTAYLWDASTGEGLVQLPLAEESWGIAFSPDGDRLATSDIAGEVTIWDTATFQPLFVLEHLPFAYKLAFSPHSSQLVSSSLDGTIKFWDIKTGEEIRTVKAHQSLIWGVAFSPDGSKLATAGGDYTVRLWDSVSGENLLTLEGHSDAITDIHFNHEGSRLITSSQDGTVRVWVLPVDELIELAHSRLTRNLTEEECQTFLHLEECPEN